MHEDGIGMARTFEREFTGHADTALRCGPGSSRRSTVRPPTGYRAPRARHRVGVVPAPNGVGFTARSRSRRSGSSPVSTAPHVLGPARRRPRSRRRAGGPGGERLLRRQHRRHRPDGRRGPRPGAGRRARGPPLPAARRVPVRVVASSTAPPRTTCPGRSRSSPPTAWPLRTALGRPDMTASHRRHRRPSQRRQVDAAQPHRRPARGHRRGEARRHPRPQGGRGRVAGHAVPAGRHRRLAARWQRARRQGESAERAGACAKPTWCCSSSTPPSASPRRTPRRRPPPAIEPAGAGRGQQGRRHEPRGRHLGVHVPRAGRAVAGRARCTAAAPATCSISLVALPARSRRRPTPRRDRADEPGPTECSRWPSSVDPTSASRRCSTGSSATSGRSCTTCRARPATRIDTVVETPDGPVRFVDTAGMRRKAKIDEGTEYYSFVRALQSDRPRRRRAARHRRAPRASPIRTSGWPSGSTPPGCPIVVLLNKWEMLDAEQRDRGRRTRSVSACTSSASRRC